MTAQPSVPVMVPPAFLHRPAAAVGSMVQQVAQLSEAVDTPMDAEQRLAVDVATAVRADGRPAALESAVITCRQNLKTFIAERICLTRLVEPERPGLQAPRLLIWSAHEFRTAQETFRHFDELISGYSFLSRRVTSVSRGNGEEEFEFRGGRRLMFRARVRTGGRGLTGDEVYLDEAFALLGAHMGSLLPTLSTRRRAKVYYLSSAGLRGSEILRAVRDRGRRGGRGAPAYIEWCAPGALSDPGCRARPCLHFPGTAGCALDREDYWQLANPAMGTAEQVAAGEKRIDIEFVRAEREALPVEEFARERLGWWDETSSSVIFPGGAWTRCGDPGSTRQSAPALALDVTPDRARASVSYAATRPDGLPMIQVVRNGEGTEWLIGETVKLAREKGASCVVLDGVGPASSLRPRLEEELAGRAPIWVTTGAEMADACAGLFDAVMTEQLRHCEQPELEAAVAGASQRKVGDRWAWDRRNSEVDITPLVSGTLALAGHGKYARPAEVWGFYE